MICTFLLMACPARYLFFEAHNADSTVDYTLIAGTGVPADRVAVIVPGLNESPALAHYQTIGRYYQQAGIMPLWVELRWKTVKVQNLAEVGQQIVASVAQRYPDAELHFFGFSFGAVIAFKMSELSGFPDTVLCSLSPVFQEDHHSLPFPLRWLMSRRGNKRPRFSAGTHGKPLVFLYAEHDSLAITKNTIATRANIYPESRTIIVNDAKHDLSGQVYLNAIGDILDERYN